MVDYRKYIKVLEILKNDTEYNDEKIASAICELFDEKPQAKIPLSGYAKKRLDSIWEDNRVNC
jgi:hypothetical protein